MEFKSQYVSHLPDECGYVSYTAEDKIVWQTLYARQKQLLAGRACDEFIQGLIKLELTEDKVPQLPEVNKCLKKFTGWEVAPVSALIPARDFFELLAAKRFPAATFLRTQAELDYVKEPDLFHELFGHCPMLTHPVYAQFIHDYACQVLSFPETDWALLQRLFWYTVEFGLVQTASGIRAYGGGILSSISETAYSVESDIPMRILFSPVAAFRTPYRIDRLQPIYFVIQNYQELYDFVKSDIKGLLERARYLKEYPPFFEVEDMSPNIHIHAC